MGPYPIVTSKPHWKSCQIKWQTSKTIIWLHRAGEQSGTGTLLSQLLFMFSTILCIFVHQKYRPRTLNYYCSRSKNCIKNQKWEAEKFRETIACKGSLGVIQTGSYKSGFRLRCPLILVYSRSVRILVRFFHYHFPFKKNLLKCWVSTTSLWSLPLLQVSRSYGKKITDMVAT